MLRKKDELAATAAIVVATFGEFTDNPMRYYTVGIVMLVLAIYLLIKERN